MDGRAFDQLTRSLRQRLDRRQALGGALAGMVAAVGLASDADAVSRRTCRPNGASCLRNSQCCGTVCETRRTAPRNQRNRCVCVPDCTDRVCGDDGCGGTCGTCGAYQACEAGACGPAVDCSTFDDAPTSAYFTLCADTAEGGAVVIHSCDEGFNEGSCDSTADCADVAAANPGRVVVCGESGKFCRVDAGGICKDWTWNTGSVCVVGDLTPPSGCLLG
jgi:hypothetical protein